SYLYEATMGMHRTGARRKIRSPARGSEITEMLTYISRRATWSYRVEAIAPLNLKLPASE
ncbi:MAG: hypothetical protein M3014_11555, partial [Chloroflexota bacterium]|nr:hypothetical protein [Chloroflexota bacterium]